MIEPCLTKKIMDGEKLDVVVYSKKEKDIDALMLWLQQFRQRHCNSGHPWIGCNRYILTDGYKLDVRIDTVPHGPRELLAGNLNSVGEPQDSPFTITTRTTPL